MRLTASVVFLFMQYVRVQFREARPIVGDICKHQSSAPSSIASTASFVTVP